MNEIIYFILGVLFGLLLFCFIFPNLQKESLSSTPPCAECLDDYNECKDHSKDASATEKCFNTYCESSVCSECADPPVNCEEPNCPTCEYNYKKCMNENRGKIKGMEGCAQIYCKTGSGCHKCKNMPIDC